MALFCPRQEPEARKGQTEHSAGGVTRPVRKPFWTQGTLNCPCLGQNKEEQDITKELLVASQHALTSPPFWSPRLLPGSFPFQTAGDTPSPDLFPCQLHGFSQRSLVEWLVKRGQRSTFLWASAFPAVKWAKCCLKRPWGRAWDEGGGRTLKGVSSLPLHTVTGVKMM